jgi:hypothetical protein
MTENNSKVDTETMRERIAIARRNFSGDNSNSKSKPTGKRLTIKDFKTIDEKWNNYSKNKAIAVGGIDVNPSAYLCYGHKSLSSATRCAIKGCQSSGVGCAIFTENNSLVDDEVFKDNLAIARRNFSGGNSSNYSSGSQSQQSSTTDKCLERMEEARDKFENGCAFTEKSYGSGLLDALAVLSKCKQKAEAQFPDMACYGASLPNIQNQDICNFKCRSSGAIFQGDCNKSRIDFGGKACYKMN